MNDIQQLPPQILNAIRELRGLDVYITGSVALFIYGKLDREISDLDLIAIDKSVLPVLRNKFHQISDAKAATEANRYTHKHEVCIDLFLVTEEPRHVYHYFEGICLKMVHPADVFLDKLKILQRTNTTPEMAAKCLSDIENYFHLTYSSK